MNNRSESATMEGGGWYNRHSSMQSASNELAMAFWKAAVEKVPVGEENIVIADYGCSQGRNSMKPLNIAIDGLRRRAGARRPVEIFHNDLPMNDFGSLFQVLEADSDSYMAAHGGVFPFAIGRSYFEPILPPSSVHAAWNSWTLQWMSKKAADAPDHVFGSMSQDAGVRNAIAAQQARDWTDFLALRSHELRPGGRLLSLFTGSTAEKHGWDYVGGELWQAVLDMEREGVITMQEAHRITVPTAQRPLEAVRAPFEKSGQFAGLEIEHLDVIQGPDPYWDVFQRTGDAGQLAQGWSGVFRGFAGPTIANALNETRDKAAILDSLFERYRARLSAHPQRHEYYFVVVVLAKTGQY